MSSPTPQSSIVFAARRATTALQASAPRKFALRWRLRRSMRYYDASVSSVQRIRAMHQGLRERRSAQKHAAPQSYEESCGDTLCADGRYAS